MHINDKPRLEYIKNSFKDRTELFFIIRGSKKKIINSSWDAQSLNDIRKIKTYF